MTHEMTLEPDRDCRCGEDDHRGTGDTRPVRRAEPLHMVEMVFPNTTNHYGTMFGGKVLDLMDRAACLAATRFSHQAMVTASMEHIDFFIPIRRGNLVELVAQVVYTGRTSLTVKVTLFSEDPIRQTREQASEGYFHMVAVDEVGTPIVVPQLLVTSDEECATWAHAEALRHLRRTRRRGSGVH